MEIILTHDNTDFDAVAALLAVHKLKPGSLPILPDRVNKNVARFMALYQNGLPFVWQRDFRAKTAKQVIIVDAQKPPQLKGLPSDLPTHIIDHHPPAREFPTNTVFTTEPVGAVTTWLVEQIQTAGTPLTSLEATLLALGIYEDTGSLLYGTTTPRDHRAAAWLLEQKASLDTIRRFLTPPLDEAQQALLDLLMAGSETRLIEGFAITVCSATVDHYISEISSVAHWLRDTLDTAILFIVVEMPESIQLVCRATVDSLDLGAIARIFGGGGHSRAAAAAIHDRNLSEIIRILWQETQRLIQPLTRVSDLMSYGVQTVNSQASLHEVARQVRQIGHEGYPVTDNGRITGLLTRRDVDRATEHGLQNLKVADIMTAGEVTLRPSDSVWLLEQKMVESGWGQIPVVDENDRLIGIVTRTDLIKHWARIHPVPAASDTYLGDHQLENVLGNDTTALIQHIADHARQTQATLYLVGGVVRDLLLGRKNLDIDFVVEGNAIALATTLQNQYGGRINAFPPFGTAKWKLDKTAAQALNLPMENLPDHIDFATARNEFYEQPTALPTVYNSSIKLDLQRRDFTINTLAVQLSPAAVSGKILDFYGGLNDLKAGLIRVLHSLSFVDDPTRILRAVRFQQRLGFSIEPRTDELIATANSMLSRITGERIRNELNLLLSEPQPENGLRELESRDALRSIHPAFDLPGSLEQQFEAARLTEFPWETPNLNRIDLYWHILACNIKQNEIESLCERLLFGQKDIQSFVAARHLAKQITSLAELRPSQIVELLKESTELTLLANWLRSDSQITRTLLKRYYLEWQHIHPISNGNTLRRMGLKPGPCYAIILKRLRAAKLDGEISSLDDELHYIQRLVHEESLCDDFA